MRRAQAAVADVDAEVVAGAHQVLRVTEVRGAVVHGLLLALLAGWPLKKRTTLL